MKKQALAVFAIATLLITLSAGSSFAFFGLVHGVRADVPFDFVVGTKTLSKGTYTVKLDNTFQHFLVITGRDNGEAAFASSITVAPEDIKDNSPKLIFHRYGDQYFLSQVWNGARLAGQELPKSQQEREHLAEGNLRPEVIAILALNR